MMAHHHSRPNHAVITTTVAHWSSIAVIAMIALIAAATVLTVVPDIHPRNAAAATPSQESRPATAAARRDVRGAVPLRRLRRYGGAGEWARAAAPVRMGPWAGCSAATRPADDGAEARAPHRVQRPAHLCGTVAVCAGASSMGREVSAARGAGARPTAGMGPWGWQALAAAARLGPLGQPTESEPPRRSTWRTIDAEHCPRGPSPFQGTPSLAGLARHPNQSPA
jgi:hypothetical protein